MAQPAHQQSAPLGEVLQWETPTGQPKRQSFLERLSAAKPGLNRGSHRQQPAATTAVTAATVSTTTSNDAPAAMPAHKESIPPPPPPPASHGRTMRQRLDAILPPHRKYLGGRLPRRSLLLFVILPLLVLLLVVLPLAIGLGVGLSRSNSQGPGRGDLPLPPSGQNPGGGQTSYKGDLTFYAPGLGACGTTSTEDDAIASVSHILFDAAATSGNPNDNPLCGRRIRITRENQGGSRGSKGRRSSSSVEVTVVDRCEGCAAADLDLSPAAFRRLAPESAGRVEGTWSWIS